MAKALAFFPWLESRKSIEVGPIRLLPWKRGTAPDILLNAELSDIDAVIGAYADRPNLLVQSATLLEFGNWHAGDDPEDTVSILFLVREMICVSALSRRRLFVRSHDYCNNDLYTLVVQKYEYGHGGKFSFSTKRRDGRSNQFWSSSEFAFFRPHHVPHRGSLSLDKDLLSALADINSVPDHVVESIREFNLANTDSNSILPHVEMVMMKSAFEFLFEIDEKSVAFTAKLKDVIPKICNQSHVDPSYSRGWNRRFPNSQRLIECWGKEFCDLRGQSTHGGRKSRNRFVWDEFWHLAFTSILYPILLKIKLEELGKYSLSLTDHAHIESVERYLTVDPVVERKDWYSKQHPWAEIHQEALINTIV